MQEKYAPLPLLAIDPLAFASTEARPLALLQQRTAAFVRFCLRSANLYDSLPKDCTMVGETIVVPRQSRRNRRRALSNPLL